MWALDSDLTSFRGTVNKRARYLIQFRYNITIYLTQVTAESKYSLLSFKKDNFLIIQIFQQKFFDVVISINLVASLRFH